MSKYILTEREKFDDAYKYQEEFNTHDEAFNRMLELYHYVAIDGNPEAIDSASYDLNSAIAIVNDGNAIEWDIEKVD